MECPLIQQATRRTSQQQRGDAAEASAARFLESRGLVVLDRGYVRRTGELDLVCVEPATHTVVFVEVRFRRSLQHGGPLGSITASKARKLRSTAAAWLQRHADPRRPARIDVIGISLIRAQAGAAWPVDEISNEISWEGNYLTWVKSAC